MPNHTAELPSATSKEVYYAQDSPLLKWGLPAIAGLGIFVVYLRTLAPSVTGGDTGELITVAYKMGVAHPPGYPLFTMLAKLFTFVPFGSVGWRVNLFSAVCDTAAAVILLLAVRRWAQNHWAGLLAAGLFAFSPVVWRYAVVGEVFALNNLIIALMLYFAVRYSEGCVRKFAYAVAFVFGLGLSNHHTSLFYGLPILVWILITGRADLWTAEPLLKMAAWFSAGLLPYLYLPWADLRAAAPSWGETSTLEGFVTHVLRREYGTFQLESGKLVSREFSLPGLGKFFSALPGQVFYIGPVLALVGLYYLLRRKRGASLIVATLVAFCFYVIVFHWLANFSPEDPLFATIHIRFWQQAILMVCVWAGLGFAGMASFIFRSRWLKVATAALALLIPLAQAARNFAAADQHLNTLVRDYGREVLGPLPSGSLLLTKTDLMVYAVAYVQQCEGYRTDVRAISLDYLTRPWMKRVVNENYPDVSIPGPFYGPFSGSGGFYAKDLFDANRSRFKLFIRADAYLYQTDPFWQDDYRLLPFGMLKMIVPNRESVDRDLYIEESEKALPNLDLNALKKYPDGSWEKVVYKDYRDARVDRSEFLLNNAENDRKALEAAAASLEDIIARFPDSPALLFKQLGETYSKLGAYDPAYRAKMKAAWLRYLELDPSSDDSEIRKAVRN